MTAEELLHKYDIPREKLPNHVAIIPNGNRTWALQRGLPASEGHNKGVEVLAEMARVLRDLGVHTASVWGMSPENVKSRPKKEILNLVRLLGTVFEKWASEANDAGARIIHLGRKDRLPAKVLEKIAFWEDKTRANLKHTLNIAFDYGGHDELFRAMKKAFADVQSGKISFEDLMKEDGLYNGKYPYHYFKNYLDTADQPYPYPDLIIRTAGEVRLSGWMPWQSVYSELYADPTLTPDYTVDNLMTALKYYTSAERKFGAPSNVPVARINLAQSSPATA